MGLKKLIRIGMAIVLTAVYLWIAVQVVDFRAIYSRMQTAIVPDLELGSACFFLVLLFRGMRVALFIGKPRNFVIWMLAIVHSGLNALLPAKLGELSLPILLRRYAGISGYSGTVALILLRLHDLLAMCIVGGVLAATFLHGYPRMAAIACVAFAVVGHVMLIVLGSRIMHAFMLLLPVRWRRLHFLCKLRDAFQLVDRAESLGAAALSICLWSLLALALYYFSSAAHYAMPMGLMGLAMSAASLAFVTPAGGIANVGPFEAAWSWVLHKAGWRVQDAISSALFVHGFVLLCSVAAGVFCMAVLFMVYKGSVAEDGAVKRRSDVQ